jgi:hypothetical protein
MKQLTESDECACVNVDLGRCLCIVFLSGLGRNDPRSVQVTPGARWARQFSVQVVIGLAVPYRRTEAFVPALLV